MKTIKATIKKTTKTTEEVEINLPAYFKSGGIHFYKCVDKETSISVCDYLPYSGIEVRNTGSVLSRETLIPITSQEFNEVFIKVMTELVNMKGNDTDTELLCEEIKRNAVNDGITTNEPQQEYGHLTAGQKETLETLNKK